MESSAAFDGAVFGEEETVTVEIVQESIETEPDDSNIIILQSMDSDQQESQVVSYQDSVASDTQFEQHVVVDEESGQFVQMPISSSAEHGQYHQIVSLGDEIQQSGEVQIVSFADSDQVYEEGGEIVSLSEDQSHQVQIQQQQPGEVQEISLVSLSDQLQQAGDVQQMVTLADDQVQSDGVQQIVTLSDQLQQAGDVQQIITLSEDQIQHQSEEVQQIVSFDELQQGGDGQHIVTLSDEQVHQQSGEVHQIVSLSDQLQTGDGQQIVTFSDDHIKSEDVQQIVSFPDQLQVQQPSQDPIHEIVTLSNDQRHQPQIVSLSDLRRLQQQGGIRKISLTGGQAQQPGVTRKRGRPRSVLREQPGVQRPQAVLQRQQAAVQRQQTGVQQAGVQRPQAAVRRLIISDGQVQPSGNLQQIVSFGDDFIAQPEVGQQLVSLDDQVQQSEDALPLIISEDNIQHPPDVQQIVSSNKVSHNNAQVLSLSDHQQLIQSLQGAQFSGNDSNIIILQPIDSNDPAVSTPGVEYVTDNQFVQAVQTENDGINQEGGISEISNIQYITSEEASEPKEEKVDAQDIMNVQEVEQANYIGLQPTKDDLHPIGARSLLPPNIEALRPIRLITPVPEAQLPDSPSSEPIEQPIPEFPDSQAGDEQQDEDDFDDGLQDPSVRNGQPQVNLVDSTQAPVKSDPPRPHVIEVFKSFDAVMTRISDIEIETNSKFVREKKNSKIFGQEWIRRPVRNEREFAWCSKNNTAGGERERLSPEIEYDGIPFINVGYIRLDCSLGFNDSRFSKTKKPLEERKRKMYTSKKIGCPAKIYVSQVTKFPDYELHQDTKDNRKTLLQQLTVDLRYDWENVEAESWYYCKFPSNENHSGHPLHGEGAGLHLPMDYRIKDKVKEWTLQGITSCNQMKALIHQFVTEQLFPGGQMVPEGRRFFPKTKEICNVMYIAKVQQLPPQLDLERIEALMDTMCNVNPGDSIHLRPSYPNGHHFMFVYQSEWQKHLLNHYGKFLVYVEPVYQYAHYPIPIYCLVVRTNNGFTIAGMFSLKIVTKPLLSEVFKLFTEWNPEWKPKHLLADFTDENIAGILDNFTATTVLLTDAYVEETWRKWIDRKDSGVVKEAASLIAMLKNVARAQTQTDFEVALEAFVNSPRYLSVVRLRRWFLAKWLPVCERWADVYKDEALKLISEGHRGKERKADLTAYLCSCLETMRETSVSKVLAYFVTALLPELFQDYSRHNIQMLSSRSQRDDIPEYLQGRPSEIVNHIMDRSDPCAFDEGVNIQELGMGNFKVNTHDVDFTLPNCSCTDWQKHHLPCKHFCVIFNHMPGWGWTNLVETYRESPLFIADPFCLEANKKMQERAEVKFEAIEEEDLEDAREVDTATMDDDDLGDTLSTINDFHDSQESESQDSQEVPPQNDQDYELEKLELAKKIQGQFQDLTKAVKERKDSAGLLRMINSKLNSVLNVLNSPAKSEKCQSPARSSAGSVQATPSRPAATNSPAHMSDMSDESSAPIVYHIKTDAEDQGDTFVYQVKTEDDSSMEEDEESDMYDPPPLFVPVNVKVKTAPPTEPDMPAATTLISIPFNSPKIVRPDASFVNSSAGVSNPNPEQQTTLLLKSTKRKATDQPTKIYVPFKTSKPHSLQTGFIMPPRAPAMPSRINRLDCHSPLKKKSESAGVSAATLFNSIFKKEETTKEVPSSTTKKKAESSQKVVSTAKTQESSPKSVTSSSDQIDSPSKSISSPLKTTENLQKSPEKMNESPQKSPLKTYGKAQVIKIKTQPSPQKPPSKVDEKQPTSVIKPQTAKRSKTSGNTQLITKISAMPETTVTQVKKVIAVAAIPKTSSPSSSVVDAEKHPVVKLQRMSLTASQITPARKVIVPTKKRKANYGEDPDFELDEPVAKKQVVIGPELGRGRPRKQLQESQTNYGEDPDFELDEPVAKKKAVIGPELGRGRPRKQLQESQTNYGEDPDFELDEPVAKKKAVASPGVGRGRTGVASPGVGRGRSRKQLQESQTTVTPKVKKEPESVAKSKRESKNESTPRLSRVSESKSTRVSESTPKNKRGASVTPAKSTGKKTNVVSTPVCVTPDNDNVRKSSRKSTSVYAGAERIVKPTGRNVFESFMEK